MQVRFLHKKSARHGIGIMFAMPLVVYLDETGDHSLDSIDAGYPLFGVVVLVCQEEKYCQQIVPSVYRFKFEHFGHEGVVLHSRDIRRAQGDFLFLRDASRRQPFYDGLNGIMRDNRYVLMGMFIDKIAHKAKYGPNAHDPYGLALTFTLERLLFMLEGARQEKVRVIAEARGKEEDNSLRAVFERVTGYGTSHVKGQRFRRVEFNLEFYEKKANLVGMQMADLAAYPIARHLLDSVKSHPSYPIVKPKIRRGMGRGLKVFPDKT